MPGLDGTGPGGMGSMTGGGRGFCNPYGSLRAGRTEATPVFYRGGFGGGRGRRNMYHLTGLPGWMRGMGPGGPCAQFLRTGQWPAPQMQAALSAASMTREQELSMLRQQADGLKSMLDQISSRVAELEKEQ